MESSDRRAAIVTVQTLGTTVAVCFERDDAVVASFRRLWSRAVVDATGAHVPDPVVTIEVADGADEKVQHLLASEVTIAAIEARAHELWTVHAAGLADPGTGAVVALVAPSGTGKSTAAQHLGRRWAYLSDETVGVDTTGTVLAHPKPISRVVEGSFLKQQVSPDEIGLVAPSGELRLGAVVLLERDGRATPLVEEVPRAEAIARVGVETSYLARLPRPLHFINAALSHAAGVWRVSYGDLDGLEDVLEDLFERAASHAGSARYAPVVQPGEMPSWEQSEELPDGHVTAASAADVLDVEGERLLLVGERVVVLSPVAAAIHRHLLEGGPMSRAELLRRLGEEMPLPDEPGAALDHLLEQLAAEAVVMVRRG